MTFACQLLSKKGKMWEKEGPGRPKAVGYSGPGHRGYSPVDLLDLSTMTCRRQEWVLGREEDVLASRGGPVEMKRVEGK